MPTPRSKPMIAAALYLSKYSEVGANGIVVPPSRLGVSTWAAAYDLFYQTCGDGRSIVAFQRSMKNARDTFDPYFPNGRNGWTQEAHGGEPGRLSNLMRNVLFEYGKLPEADFYNAIRPLIA